MTFWAWLFLATQAFAQTTVVYQDDFEGTVSGWSDNSTDFAPAVTRFLGRFSAGQTSTSRSFTVPANSDELIIEFDLYRFDSWDNFAQFGFDRFEVVINGTEIFSLPFPNPQAARSGSTGNITWSHSPLTGTEELGFVTGQFWFDQLHRFEIIVDNPGATVDLTLTADLSQGENDESGGFDNFLVTAVVAGNNITAIAETFPAIDGLIGGVTSSVLASDTINGVPLNPNDVTLSSTSSSDPNVTLNLATGLISVAPSTPAGSYTVEYEICENIDLTNCSSVTETVEVFIPSGSAPFCPASNNLSTGVFHVVSATGADNPSRAVGAPLSEGTQDTGANSGTTFFPSVIYDLTGDPNIFAPTGTVIEVSLASHFGSNAQIAVSSSLSNTGFPAAGSTGSQTFGVNTANNSFVYFDYTVPAGGARFLELDHLNGGIRFDGVIFDSLCTPPPNVIIVAEDDTATVADSSLGDITVVNVLDNDTIDGTLPTVFDLALAPGESLPTGLTFDASTGTVDVLQNTPTGVYSFDYVLCEAGEPLNCDIATVTITVTNPNPPMLCPPGTTETTGSFHVVNVTSLNGTPTNPNGALGVPLDEGLQDNNSTVSGVTFFQSLIYDLTGDPDILIPEGTAIDLSLANHFNSNPTGNIFTSQDGNNYTAVGSSAAPWTNNTFRYDEYIVPSGGARFLQIEYGGSGGLRFDGVIYNTQCQAALSTPTVLTGNKTVEIFDPQNLGLYAIPGNDVIYTITVENTGSGDVDSGSLLLIDAMPTEISFFNDDLDDGGPETAPVSFQEGTSGLTFDFNTDARFSNAASPPSSFADCTYTPLTGYDPDVTFICVNPKGTMLSGSNWSVSFRARID